MEKYLAKTSIKKTITLFLLILLVAGGITINSIYTNYTGYLEEPISDKNKVVKIEIESDSNTTEIYKNLYKNGLEIKEKYYNLYLRQNPELASGIQAGRYVLNKNMSLKEIIEDLQEAEIETIKATFPEGITYKEMANILDNQFFVVHEQDFNTEEFTSIIENPDNYSFEQDIEKFLRENKPANKPLEGFLYPATYEFEPEVTSKEVVSRLVREFIKRSDNLPESISNRTLYQNLILASIVEKESYTNEEKTLVASVFHNRLEIGMRLESDATINYVTGEDRPRPTYDDLEAESPYNTYQNTGLPPTPINNPRFESLSAAVTPEESDYHYFIHEQNVSRQVHFAETHEGHLQNVEQYLD